MANKKYRLQYLPLFEQDLVQTVSYITNVLKNPDAAEKLANDVEAAILERMNNPLMFEPYPSVKKNLCAKLCGLLCCYRRDDGSPEISLWGEGYGEIFIKDAGKLA